jgi:hypothetical protein
MIRKTGDEYALIADSPEHSRSVVYVFGAKVNILYERLK